MITINDKSLCCGCSACQKACPRHCIIMKADEEGFLYPEVDAPSCVNCGLCEKVCQELHPFEKRTPLKAIAAHNNDTTTRLNSSSGGVYSILAEQVILQGGVVFGALFDDNWQVKLKYAEDLDEASKFRCSKYVQAEVGNSYRECEKFLKEDRKVLFSGTPCQIAGLLHFLKKPYENLITVDVACHGVPSPMVWTAYLDIIRNALSIEDLGLLIRQLQFLKFDLFYHKDRNVLELWSKRHENDYMAAFIKNLTLRPSCYNCQCKNFKSQSDLTIADFWGVETIAPHLDDNKGICLVLINTQRGACFFESTSVCSTTVEMKSSIAANPALTVSAPRPDYREDCVKPNSNELLIQNIRNGLKDKNKKKIDYLRKSISSFCHLIFRTLGLEKKEAFIIKGKRIKNKGQLIKVLGNSRFGEINAINFRNKIYGWKQYGLSIEFRIEK